MHIIKASEPIPVEHPVVCIFGQPGIGKSSLGYSAADPLLLDLDQGAHRAINRRDTLKVTTWADVAELVTTPAALAPYQTLVVDTVGRLLDLITADILEGTPKLGRDGTLTLQGYGALKTRFRTFMTQLRTLGKDVVLLAHLKEEKDGDVTVMRPDIIGASYGEVMKVSDCVGYMAMQGRSRVVDFSPTDRWVGKNPAQWKPIVVPAAAQATTVLATLIDQVRSALGAISTASAVQAQQVTDWRAAIETYTLPEEFTRASVAMATQPEIVKAQVRPAFQARLTALGLTFDKATKQYVAPAPAPPPVVAHTPATDLVW